MGCQLITSEIGKSKGLMNEVKKGKLGGHDTQVCVGTADLKEAMECFLETGELKYALDRRLARIDLNCDNLTSLI